MLYGVALMAALSNTVVVATGVTRSAVDPANVSLGLLGWGLILYIHHRRGWPPFRR